MHPDIRTVVVFADGPGGGNPAPVVLGADAMTDQQMQDVARDSGHESAFVLPAPEGSAADIALRFWVPDHEMEMCGHATVGAVWLLASLGILDEDHVTVSTASGDVEARIRRSDASVAVEISQPAGRVVPVSPGGIDAVVSVLGIDRDALAGRPVVNATTSRTKTLIPLVSERGLDDLRPDLARVERLCTELGSTGLYPYAVSDDGPRRFSARQFPRSSGYPEDPATGIAAAALLFGLLDEGLVGPSDHVVTIRQGRAMGRPSAISLRLRVEESVAVGCWLGGSVEIATTEKES
jgi:PhzF family phenazine biosynthesis protein